MMNKINTYPTELLLKPLPLPKAVAQASLNERGVFVMQGLDTHLARQLVGTSLEVHVVQFCANDSLGRQK